MPSPVYLLPTHPSFFSDDPLGVVAAGEGIESSDGSHSAAAVLQSLLRAAMSNLATGNADPALVWPVLVEEIAWSLHRDGNVDTSFLRRVLGYETFFTNRRSGAAGTENDHDDSPLKSAVLCILHAACDLPTVFPLHSVPFLSHETTLVTFTPRQVDALLAHMALCALHSSPAGGDWGRPGFVSWYSGSNASKHTEAVTRYIEILASLFARGGYSRILGVPADQPWLTFALSTCSDNDPSPSDLHHSICPLFSISTVPFESHPSSSTTQLPPFMLIPSHRNPGPGPSATTEELILASSPALCLISLVCPSIPSHSAVVTSSVPVEAAWSGYGRTARVTQFPLLGISRRFVAADALELDAEFVGLDVGIPDLHHDFLRRELSKLRAAFNGAQQLHLSASHDAPPVIETPPWGCGAFGGNILVKAALLAVAAGMEDVQLRLFMVEGREGVAQVSALEGRRVGELWGSLVVERRERCRNMQELADFMNQFWGMLQN